MGRNVGTSSEGLTARASDLRTCLDFWIKTLEVHVPSAPRSQTNVSDGAQRGRPVVPHSTLPEWRHQRPHAAVH